MSPTVLLHSCQGYRAVDGTTIYQDGPVPIAGLGPPLERDSARRACWHRAAVR